MFETQPIARPAPNPLRKFIFGGLVVLLLWLAFNFFSGGSRIIIADKDLLAVPWPSELEFAGEAVPLDDFYVRESWEKEFLINLSQDYQNILYLKRAPKYFPFIEAELARRGLPEDLKYVAVAESGLREDAASSAGAAGIWQFIPSTGAKYGLTIGDAVDERQHFERATLAALDYFEFLHGKFGAWTLAAAAYNRGENGLARDLTDQDVNSYYDLYLNSETARYLFRILAIKQIMEHPAEYGYELGESDYFAWPDFREVSVGAVGDLAAFAREQGSNLRTLKELNPWIVGRSLPAGEWQVRIPE